MPAPHAETSRARWRWLGSAEWDAVVASSPGASGFQSRAWLELRARLRPKYVARCLGLPTADGALIALPVLLRRGWMRRSLLARALANVAFAYGGPLLAGRHLDERHWRELVAAPFPLGRLDVTGNPHERAPPWLVARASTGSDFTNAVDLRALPEDIASSFASSARRAVRKAQAAGVTVAREEGAAAVAEYRAIHEDTRRRWGPGADEGEPWSLVEQVLRLPGSELWLARSPDGRAAAGAVVLSTPAISLYWHGGMLAELAALRPANALHLAILRAARARGAGIYDLGRNPSAERSGVQRFKETLGARRIDFATWRHRHAAFQLLAPLRGATPATAR